MTTIHLISGGKGNIGKTAFTETLATIAIAAGMQPYLVDADMKKQTLSKLRGSDVTKIVLSDDPMFETQCDRIWKLASQKEGDVIVDLAAQSDHILTDWMDTRGIAQIARNMDIGIIKWWIADLDPDSFVELADSRNRYAHDGVLHVLVQSHHRIRPLIWEEFMSNNSSVKAELKNGLKAICFPRMFTGLMDKMREKGQTLTDTLLDTEFKHTEMIDQSTVANWINTVVSEVESVYSFSDAVSEQPVKKATKSSTKASGKSSAKPAEKAAAKTASASAKKSAAKASKK